jgi:hypothetical protein
MGWFQAWRDRPLDRAREEYHRDRLAMRIPFEQLDPQVRELVEIAIRHALVENEERVQAIGRALYAAGGHERMVAAHGQVHAWAFEAPNLNAVWDGVGDWRR